MTKTATIELPIDAAVLQAVSEEMLPIGEVYIGRNPYGENRHFMVNGGLGVNIVKIAISSEGITESTPQKILESLGFFIKTNFRQIANEDIHIQNGSYVETTENGLTYSYVIDNEIFEIADGIPLIVETEAERKSYFYKYLLGVITKWNNSN
jgi:hypothetical protein